MVHCSLCKKNGESEAFYSSHKLKDENNNVICPILKNYTCPRCNQVGKHTASYCPRNETFVQQQQKRQAKRNAVAPAGARIPRSLRHLKFQIARGDSLDNIAETIARIAVQLIESQSLVRGSLEPFLFRDRSESLMYNLALL